MAIYFVSPHGGNPTAKASVLLWMAVLPDSAVCEEDIQKFLDRRKPGQSKFTTQRRESDTVEILSGVFEGKTTGTPISMMVWNEAGTLPITVKFQLPTTDRDMLISVLTKNTDFVITAAADAPRGAKRSDALPAVQLRSKF